MNRRNFIKSAILSLTVLGLGIKAKAQEIITGEIITGVGRGSPRMLDAFGLTVKIPTGKPDLNGDIIRKDCIVDVQEFIETEYIAHWKGEAWK